MTEEQEKYLPAKAPISMSDRGLAPTDFDGLWRMSQIMHKSGLMPKGLNTAEAVFVAVQMGLEVGLSPMAAVQNIAVINGRPAIWGDAVLALVRGSGLLEDFREELAVTADNTTATCVAVRMGQKSAISRSFSVDDAKRANLWGKDGPWKQYPKRMLQMRARSWVLRDGFSDVLRGFRQAEEVSDVDIDLDKAQGYSFAQPPESIDVGAEFDAAFGGGDAVAEFVSICARAARKSNDEIRAEALSRADDFRAALSAWADKNNKTIDEPFDAAKSAAMDMLAQD